MRRRVLSVAVLVLIGVSSAACSALRASERAERPLVVVLFDVSRSTHDPDVRARYLATFEQVLDHVVTEHGTIVADVIDDNPLAHSTYPIHVTFDACDAFTDNRLECDADIARSRDGAGSRARSILEDVPTVRGTDIHDGLSLAERVFDAYPEAGTRSLVILSDMVEHSTRLNVARASFDADAIEPTLESLATEGLIPDLSGVSVYVVGAGATPGSALSADRFLAIQRFWQAYVARAGTDLPTERYGAALVRFP